MSALSTEPLVQRRVRFDPETADIAALRADLVRIREEKGRGSGWALNAFQRLNQAAAAQGRPLNGLRKYSPVESERFFAQTIPGPDGHVYWDGTRNFLRNDGRYSSSPRRWWWEHIHGPIGSATYRVKPTCGELACINPEHCECKHFREGLRYTDREMLGALQVMALRLGHPPNSNEWEAHGGRPTDNVYYGRFGSWAAAMREAGLDYQGQHTPASCIKTLRYLRKRLNRWPLTTDPARFSADLRALGLPASDTTIRRHLGDDWEGALRRAGKR